MNSDRYHECLLAMPWADVVVVPINSRWTAAEVGYVLRNSGVVGLIVDEAYAPMVAALREFAPGLCAVAVMGDGQPPAGARGYEALVATSHAVDDSRRGGDDLFGDLLYRRLTTIDLCEAGLVAFPYLNVWEDVGSLSLAVLPETIAWAQTISLPATSIAASHGCRCSVSSARRNRSITCRQPHLTHRPSIRSNCG